MSAVFDQERMGSRLFPALAYDPENGVFLLEDRSLGFGFLCDPLSGGDQGIQDRVNVFLNQEWPIDTLIQVSLWTSPDIQRNLAVLKSRRSGSMAEVTQGLVGNTLSFLQDGTRNAVDSSTHILIRRCQVIITVKLPTARPQPTEAEVERAKSLRLTSLQSLITIGLRPQPLTADRYVRLMSVMLNWDEGAGWLNHPDEKADETQLIRDQFLDYGTDIRLDRSGVWLGDKRVKTLSVKRYPDHLYFGSARSYLGDVLSGARGIKQNCLITLTLHYPDSETTKAKLDTVRQWVTNQAYGPILKFVPHLGVRKQSFDLLFNAFMDGDRPVRGYLGVVLFCGGAEEAQAVSNARVYFRELGFQLLEDKYFTLPLFLNCLPLGAERSVIRDSNRYKTFGTRHVIPLLPIFADWPGTGTPTLNLISRTGQLMSFSLFDSASNYNACIAAQSGSGKSFLTNELIVSSLAEGARVWVIDVGRSYMNLAESLDGEFMAFTPKSNLCINPFDLVRNWDEEADVIAGLVTSMAAPTEKLSDFQTASLKRILRDVWEEKGNEMSVDDVAARLKAQKDQRIVDLGEQLFPFTQRGEYGRFFNGRNTVRFSGDFTVLELEELKGRRHLQQVVLLQLIYQIQQAMYLGERDRPKLVVIDESWDLLTLGDAATFMEHGYRRFRKYGGSAITITQSVNDLYRTSTGRAIVENSAHMILLGQKAEAVEALRSEKRLPLPEGGYNLLKTVHTIPGVYSELFILTEMGAGIGRLIVDPFKRLLFSTKPDDVHQIRQLRMQGIPITEAIQTLLDRRRQRHVH
jgi:conjugal transfer ATP-binding protein TraC